jgi:hypothetical protein
MVPVSDKPELQYFLPLAYFIFFLKIDEAAQARFGLMVCLWIFEM